MAVIKWRESFNTGVAQFDREHHKVVELIDAMYQAIRDTSDREVVIRACDDIVAYADYHFTNEEQAMAAVSYPDLEQHRVEHDRLREQARAFRTRIKSSFPDGVSEFYHFLRSWLVEHIQECDRNYGPYLKDLPETARRSSS